MPRPKNGYVNAAGQPVPGTHDPINRFMDKTALMHWATTGAKMACRSMTGQQSISAQLSITWPS